MKQRSSIRSLPFSLPFFDSGCTCSFCWGYRVPILRRNPGRCRRSYACVLWKGDHARRHNLLCSMAFHAAEAANLQPRRPADLMRPTNPINPINPVTRTSPISPIILISLRCPINTIIPTSPISPIGQSIKTELLNFPDRANNNPHGGSNGHGCCPACGHIWLGWPQMLDRCRELMGPNRVTQQTRHRHVYVHIYTYIYALYIYIYIYIMHRSPSTLNQQIFDSGCRDMLGGIVYQ